MKRSCVPLSILALCLVFSIATAQATEFYVSPAGSPSGTGSISSPWDLATALAQPTAVKPGDTIWLRGGTYSGYFSSNLNGASGNPIIVRQYPGERAVIDGGPASGVDTLTVGGSWTWYWDFEVTNSNPQRWLTSPDVRGGGVVVEATNSKFINMIVHDTGQGFSFWTPALNSELYGNLIYYNGFDLPDRGHGHGIYAQNNTGTKTIQDNIIFDQYGWGIHVYTQSGQINNFNIDGNISFDNGSVSFSSYTNNILVGGYVVANNINITNNYTYYTPAAAAGYNNIGYSAGCSNTTVNNNYFASGYFAISLPNCTPTQMTGNTFYGTTPGWIAGAYTNNVITGTRPVNGAVYVRPNQYEPGRGNIVIFNWPLQSAVSVDLSSLGLAVGQQFTIMDAENFFGAPVVAGTYTGAPVSIPMTGLQRGLPVGNVDTVPPDTAPEFGAFVVLPVGGSGSSVVVSVNPGTVTLAPSKTQQFSAGVVGSSNTGVTWSLNPQVGTISSSGFYTAPSTIAAVQKVTVSATSVADTTKSASATITLSPPPTAVAQFVQLDTTTQGNWKSAYGGDGFNVIGDSSSYPAYAAVVPGGQSSWTWASSTSDVRALQKNTASDRIAATWYSNTAFTVDINLTDGKTHQLAAYCIDWENAGRGQTVDLLDAGTGIVLDTRTLSSFTNGQYLVWNASGHVILRFTKTAGVNAVVSGIFFGGSQPVTSPPPTGSLTSSAVFVKADTATQGNWKTAYGADGYNVLGDASVNPSYATVAPNGNSYWSWAASTADVRALQKSASSTDRVAATWYSNTSFTLDVNSTDGKTHQLALYVLDWDYRSRAETIQVADAATGTVLDSRTISSFGNGEYLVWNISGHVTLKLTNNTGSLNAVLSGIFFGGAAGGSTSTPPTTPPTGTLSGSAQFLKNDSSTQGGWKSAYGAEGYNVLGDTSYIPSYATVAPSGNSYWLWAASSTDPRALQKASSTSDRAAASWYSTSTFSVDINITDGKTHQLAVYGVDWDMRGRGETVAVLDAATGTVLDTRTLSNFNNGQYLVWNVGGHVTLRFTCTAGINAVLSGIFFGGAAGTSAPSAQFITTDATTQGNWKNVYGKNGYVLVADGNSPPAFAAVNTSQPLQWTWAASTSDVRALQKSANPSDRIAATWYSNTSFALDVNITDGIPHQIAVYCVDFDKLNRAQTVQILDAQTKAVLDTRSVTAFAGGEYLVWSVTGHILIQATSTAPAPANPVISSIFF